MLNLHNWGGTGFVGAADPAVLVERYNVIAIGVDYVQSGRYDPTTDPPYDFGWYQALDALRGLYFVWHGLETMGRSYDRSRVYATGGSGGGNVALMANKLAPRTFACVIDLSGMVKLPDDIAFGLPGRTHLNAGYSSDPNSRRYLTQDDQELRFVGLPKHAKTLKDMGNTAKVIVVHGVEDDACPFEDAKEMVDNLQRAGLDIVPHFIAKADIDGSVIKDCKHSLGDRTLILQRFADVYLLPAGTAAVRRNGKADFEWRDERVRYKSQNGHFIVSYTQGYPTGRFESGVQAEFQDR
ncbi:MAG: hypothetical protein QG656_2199 [Candidatus Hydrogenedentes bacterium]|nr:hypothetical protein [Candidatus Hydrogenedentota bacterium]